MISIDKLETNTEKLIDKVKALSFQFQDPQLAQEAETAREEAIASLESFLDIANTDWEQRGEEEKSEEEND